MDRESRKELIQARKDAAKPMGVYRVYSSKSGHGVLATSRDLPAILNRHRAQLSLGSHPDKEMHEIPGANHYYSGPDQRETLAQAVAIVTDWTARHGFS